MQKFSTPTFFYFGIFFPLFYDYNVIEEKSIIRKQRVDGEKMSETQRLYGADNEQLQLRMYAQALEALGKVLESYKYSPGNQAVPIDRSRQPVVSELSDIFLADIIHAGIQERPRKLLRALVEQAAKNLGYVRGKVRETVDADGNRMPINLLNTDRTHASTYWVNRKLTLD